MCIRDRSSANQDNCVEEKWDSYGCPAGKLCGGGVCNDPAKCVPNCIKWNDTTDSCGNPVVRCPPNKSTPSCTGAYRTFYCVDFSCTLVKDETGKMVKAERCESGVWENGGGVGGSSGIVDGKIEYQGVWLPKNCFVSQTDYFTQWNGQEPIWGSYNGHTMFGDRIPINQCLAVTLTPIPERTLSGTVYCQDDGGPVYPMPGVPMTIVRNGLDTITANTTASGLFSASLTGAHPQFAIRLPTTGTRNNTQLNLPDAELSNSQPYSSLEGPELTSKSYCNYIGWFNYEQCVVATHIDHENFDFRFTNCEPSQIYPQCFLIQMGEIDPAGIIRTFPPESAQIGQEVNFICTATNPTLVDWYEFRVAKRVGVDQQEFFPLPVYETGSNVSATYTIMPGEYVAQCRVCYEAVSYTHLTLPTKRIV